MTGITAQWSEDANGGRGGYVFPGLSEKMGGPAGVKAGQQDDSSGVTMDADLKKVRDLMSNEKYSDAYMALTALDGKKYKGNKMYDEMLAMLKAKVGQ